MHFCFGAVSYRKRTLGTRITPEPDGASGTRALRADVRPKLIQGRLPERPSDLPRRCYERVAEALCNPGRWFTGVRRHHPSNATEATAARLECDRRIGLSRIPMASVSDRGHARRLVSHGRSAGREAARTL